MKKLQITAAFFFGIGLLSKFFHLAFSSLELLIGAILFTIHLVLFAFKFYKSDLTNTLFHTSITAISISLLFQLLNWSLGNLAINVLLLLAFPILTIASFFSVSFKEKNKFTLSHGLIVLYTTLLAAITII
jgi:hypothetical protein